MHIVHFIALQMTCFYIPPAIRRMCRLKSVPAHRKTGCPALLCVLHKNVKIAVKALLRGQVMDLGLHYISKGYIPPYGLETLRNYYDPYVALGDGDPSIKHIVETCESLPVHSGEMEVNT